MHMSSQPLDAVADLVCNVVLGLVSLSLGTVILVLCLVAQRLALLLLPSHIALWQNAGQKAAGLLLGLLC